jgi:HK97 gp10 family phage protein
VVKRVGPAATSAGARLVRDEVKAIIRANPSVDEGDLLGSVIVKKLGKKDTSLTAEHIVTFRRGRRKKGKQPKTPQKIAPHAVFVEFGTVKMSAEPSLRPGFERRKRDAADRIIERLRKRIEKAEGGK